MPHRPFRGHRLAPYNGRFFAAQQLEIFLATGAASDKYLVIRKAFLAPVQLQLGLVMQTRHRTKHTLTFQERLAAEAIRLKEQARKLPAGLERDALLRKASQAETAAHLDKWLTSPGLQPPKPVRP